MRLPADFYRRKLAVLRGRLQAAGLAGLLAFKPTNLYYLLGFFYLPTERVVAAWVPAEGDPVLFIPRLEQDHAATHEWLTDVEVYFEHLGPPHPIDWIASRLKRRGVGRGQIGYEGVLAEGVLARLRRELAGVRWSPEGGNIVTDMRLVKDSEELALVCRAGEYADFMVACGAETVCQRGLLSELEIDQIVNQAVVARMSAELEAVVFADGLSGGRVCAGPRAALPHGPSSLARPRPGDCLLLSFGCSVGGYHAESERTFFLGEPSVQQQRLFEAVGCAQAAGLGLLAAGRPAAAADRVSGDTLRQAGYGDFIRHRLGHGLGLDSHEGPWLEPGDSSLLRAGMVVSAEPGLYLPGQGGCRISDTVIVGRAGPEPATCFPRDLASAVLPIRV